MVASLGYLRSWCIALQKVYSNLFSNQQSIGLSFSHFFTDIGDGVFFFYTLKPFLLSESSALGTLTRWSYDGSTDVHRNGGREPVLFSVFVVGFTLVWFLWGGWDWKGESFEGNKECLVMVGWTGGTWRRGSKKWECWLSVRLSIVRWGLTPL